MIKNFFLAAVVVVAHAQQPPNDPWFSFSPSNRVPWEGGSGYAASTYQWGHQNTGQQIEIFDAAGNALLQYTEPTGTASANIVGAWAAGSTHARDIKIALVDLGVDESHPDLAGRLLPGVTVLGGVAYPGALRAAHGTQMAGIIGAIGNNGLGIAGVLRDGAQILPVTISGRTVTDYAAAVEYAVAQQCRIIHFPHGGNFESPELKAAFVAARNAGVLIVCAAVQGLPTPANDWPALWAPELDNIVLVGGHNLDGSHWPDSGWQHEPGYIAFLAPGRRIPTLDAYISGTSAASAFATGVAALVWQKHPAWSYQTVKQALGSGGGLLDAGAAVTWTPEPSIVWKIPAGLHDIESTEDFDLWQLVEQVTGPTDYTIQVPRTGKRFFRYVPVALLSWSPVSGATGYRVYSGDEPGRYTRRAEVGNATNSPATRGAYAVTAYDADGQESIFSNETIFP